MLQACYTLPINVRNRCGKYLDFTKKVKEFSSNEEESYLKKM